MLTKSLGCTRRRYESSRHLDALAFFLGINNHIAHERTLVVTSFKEEMIPNLKMYRMADVGTRLQHLAELQELWSFAWEIETLGYQTEPAKERAYKLEAALMLLEAHMTHDYSPTTYAQVINNLPKDAKDIKDERDADATGTSSPSSEEPEG